MTLDLETLQEKLEYRFADPALAQRALTHRSAQKQNNERLEFLGDAVLGLVAAEILLQKYPEADEGELSRVRASIVNKDVLANVARDLNLGPLLRLGSGEVKSGGRDRESILADSVEALIAAIYLDSGLEPCRVFISKWIAAQHLEAEGIKPKDFKTQLQEILQSQQLALPEYEVVDTTGAEHSQVFHVSCRVVLLEEAQQGSGRSKRAAEQDAAERVLREIREGQ